MKKITIIGANSYIARNFISYLYNETKDFLIHLYDYADQHLDNAENYTAVNILNLNEIAKIDLNADLIYMFVGKTGSVNGFDEFDSFIDINEKALLHLLNEYRRQHSKGKIIFPSTRLIYKGNSFALKENSEKEFKTIYAINKYSCEKYLEQYHNVYDVQYCIFRICIPYGTLIPNASSYGTAEFMLNKARKGEDISLYGDGSVRRTITHIEDLCRALLVGGESENCCNDVFNIGGEDYSLREMAELISKKYAVGIEYVSYPKIALKVESGSTVFDDSKFRTSTKFTYCKSFKDWCQQ